MFGINRFYVTKCVRIYCGFSLKTTRENIDANIVRKQFHTEKIQLVPSLNSFVIKLLNGLCY